MSRAFEWMLKLVEMRRDRSVGQSKRARQEWARSQEFTQQLQGYAAEYDQQWAQVAQRGDTALMLHTTSSFGDNLRGTASAQAQETDKLQAHSQKLLQQALQDTRRVEALQNYMARQQSLRRAKAERREEKQLEDDLNARRGRS
jgi:flagellar biosynthesis chaperone FliJ